VQALLRGPDDSSKFAQLAPPVAQEYRALSAEGNTESVQIDAQSCHVAGLITVLRPILEGSKFSRFVRGLSREDLLRPCRNCLLPCLCLDPIDVKPNALFDRSLRGVGLSQAVSYKWFPRACRVKSGRALFVRHWEIGP
jgi:hypothetical protein